MNDPIYRDENGMQVSLETLCRREPEWAASRIRHMRVVNEMLTEKLTRCAEMAQPVIVLCADCPNRERALKLARGK